MDTEFEIDRAFDGYYTEDVAQQNLPDCDNYHYDNMSEDDLSQEIIRLVCSLFF